MSGRIRSIKPEVLEDELASSLSDSAWRLWVSLWVLADDHGNVRLGDRYLAANVWQDTTRDPSQPLSELIAKGFLSPYAVRSQRYGRLSGWKRHQRIDHPGKPRVPVPEEDDGTWNQQLGGSFSDNITRPSDSLARLSETLGDPRSSRVRARTHARDHDHDQRPTTNEKGPSIAAADAARGSTEPPHVLGPSQGEDQEPASRVDVRESSPSLAEPAVGLPVPVVVAATQSTLPLPEAAKSADAKARAVRDVFDHWVSGWKRVVGAGRTPQLDDKRRGRIRARLAETFTVDDLKRAIDGMWATPWNVEKKFYDIELVCRDSAHVERFMANAPAPEKLDEEPPAKEYGPPAIPTPEQMEMLRKAFDKPATPLLAAVQAADAVGADVAWTPKAKTQAGGRS